jgi:hypothetical protein
LRALPISINASASLWASQLVWLLSRTERSANTPQKTKVIFGTKNAKLELSVEKNHFQAIK